MAEGPKGEDQRPRLEDDAPLRPRRIEAEAGEGDRQRGRLQLQEAMKARVKKLRAAAEVLRDLEQNDLAARCDDQANRLEELLEDHQEEDQAHA